jgi:hypothetical protein
VTLVLQLVSSLGILFGSIDGFGYDDDNDVPR